MLGASGLPTLSLIFFVLRSTWYGVPGRRRPFGLTLAVVFFLSIVILALSFLNLPVGSTLTRTTDFFEMPFTFSLNLIEMVEVGLIGAGLTS